MLPKTLTKSALASAAILGFLLAAGAASAGPASKLLPDLQSVVPSHLSIQNEHQREMLRLTNGIYNTGGGPLQIRGTSVAPCPAPLTGDCTYATQEILDSSGNVVSTSPSGFFYFHEAHNHWHQSDVASFVLRAGSLAGPVVAASYKVTFCLIDFDKSSTVKRNSERVYWECNGDLQGISPGWIDEYHQATDGQELDITGAPAGDYYLIVDVDPADNWVESDESNNAAWVKFSLSRKGANPEITILGNSPCSGDLCGNTANK
jgi:hypothetical protein